VAGDVVPPHAPEGRGPRQRDGDGGGVDVRLPSAGHEHNRARQRRPVLGEGARGHLEAAQWQPRALAVAPEPKRVERLEGPPERRALLHDWQRGRQHPVVVHFDLVHRRVCDPDQPRLFFKDDEEAQLWAVCVVSWSGDPPRACGSDWAHCEGSRSPGSVAEIRSMRALDVEYGVVVGFAVVL